MRGRGLPSVVAVLLLALPALAAGCDGSGAGSEATPGVSPTVTEEVPMATATLAPTTTPAPDIRQQDLARRPELRSFLDTAGGEVDTGRIMYADLTGDGVEDAVVPVPSGGTAGDIAVFVFGYGPDGLEELLRVLPDNRSLRADVIEGTLTITEPVFGLGDPLGDPSELRTTTYGWDGSRLVVTREETAPAEGS